ncbi:cysteine/serine-rich nuclear protein 2 isoform X2 [Ambystoma mexicanum]|uniref:cysteine/serine-rich nuclear protein 2 isoform X2 n=1 Tax=Ambystoma mexicanum TaxID=8296 RepID=UPI0037E7938C
MDAVTSASLKRRFEEVDVGSPISTPKDSDDEISNSDSADSCDSLNPPTTTGLIPTSILKRQKLMRRKNVRFDQVTVYYFPRRQGFTSVPSQGGSSLGMAQRHNSIRQYTLCEFAQEQEVSHRQILREHLKVEKLRTRKLKVDRMSFPCGCSRDGCSNLAGRIEFNPIRVRTHYLHTIMKLELENKRPPTRLPSQEEVSPQGFTCDSSCTLPPETQDFQEFIAENCHLENETAVRHLQSAEEMARLKEEEDEDSSTSSLSLDSSVESLGVCLLEEPLAGPGGVIDSLASSPVLLDAKLPLGSSVLCFTGSSDRATPSVGDQTFISNTPVVYYQIGQNSVLSVRGQEVSETAENPSSYLKEKDFNIFPVLGNTQEEPATVHQQESGQCCLGAECVFSEGCRSPLVAGTDPDSLCSLRNMQLPIHIGDGESTGGPARERSVPELRRETTCHLSEISKPQVEAMHGGNALAV